MSFFKKIPLWLIPLWPMVSDAGETLASKETVASTPAEYVVKTIVSLGLVIAAIVFVAWMAKKINRFNGIESGQIKVISSLSIGAKEKILLIEVGNEQILVGATSDKITPLLQLKEHVGATVPHAEISKFNGFLNGIISRHKNDA